MTFYLLDTEHLNHLIILMLDNVEVYFSAKGKLKYGKESVVSQVPEVPTDGVLTCSSNISKQQEYDGWVRAESKEATDHSILGW